MIADDLAHVCAEHTVAIAFYDNEKSRIPAEQQVSGWDSIIGLLTTHEIRSKKSGKAFAPHRLRPGASRSNDGVIALSMLVVDSDKGTSFDDVASRFEGFQTVIYTTHSHTQAITKVRAVAPLSEEVQVEDWQAFLVGASDQFGEDIFDPSTKDPARLYYLPSCPPQNIDHRRSQVLSGEFLNPRPLVDRGRAVLAQSVRPSRLSLDITGSSDRVQFPFNEHNAARYLEAVKAAYPDPEDYETFRDLLFECAELVIVQGWPESEVKQTYDWVCSQAVGADRSNNDTLWTDALERTRSRVAGGMPYRSHRSTFDRAHKNGWRDITGAAKACLPTDTSETLNDAGNADRFVSVYRPDVRYVSELSAWIVWRDGHWRYTLEGQILERAKQVAKGIYAEAADAATISDRNALGRWANASLQLARLKAMVELAKAPLSVSVNDLDADPMLLGVRNGVVELKTGAFRQAHRDDLITKIAQVEYVPDAECPAWQAMLERCMGGSHGLVGYLKRIAGYCLTGLTVEQKFFFLHGSGANGKTTFVNVLREIIGDYARQSQTEVIMVSRNAPQSGATPELVRLAGARLVCMVETEDGQRLAESRIKQMTGGDAITARALHCAPFEFVPIFKLLLSGNHLPVIRGDDAGIWRRIELIPFTVTIPPGQREKDLPDRLRSEYSGILNWMIRGCIDWRRIGLQAPVEVTRSLAEYRSDMDLVGQWIDEHCEIGAAESLRSRVGYSDFVHWLKSGGHRDITETRFALKLSERGYNKVKDRNGALYQGLGLRQRPQF
jgi:putative DNA primase/helicase